MKKQLFGIINYLYEIYQSVVWSFGKRPFVIYRQINPNQSYKHRVIRYYAKKYRCNKLVETGTFRGETLQAVAESFDDLYSIEIVDSFFHYCVEKFKNNSKIHLYNGDSAKCLGKVIEDAYDNKSSFLFWLDGHYSGGDTGMGDIESPIIEEIRHIFEKTNGKLFVILIDDARDFIGKNGYPTYEEIENLIHSLGGDYIERKSDIIRIIKGSISD